MKLRSLIIDDEPLAHKVILEYAREAPFLEIVGQCYLATEALSFLSSQSVDLIFLDIQMPKLKGLDFLRTLPRKPIVIVTSAHEEYALESYELDVCDYLLKPFRFSRFLKAVNKAQLLAQQSQNPAPLPPSSPLEEEPRQLFIKADKRLIQVELTEVYFLESYGNFVKVWLADTFHLTARTLSGFEAELPESDFFRIHKSYIINRKYIRYVEGNTLALKNDKTLPIGKNYRQGFMQFIS
ncbi:MAG: response regulator transcription factor [Lewinellaceae bacterium]|nr:response regulator transcription factor [Lewinellaceae bacterium]